MKARELAKNLNETFANFTAEAEESYREKLTEIYNNIRSGVSDEYRRVVTERTNNGKNKVSNFASVGMENQMLDWVTSVCDNLKIPWIKQEELCKLLKRDILEIGTSSGLDIYRDAIKEGVHTQSHLQIHQRYKMLADMMKDIHGAETSE